MFRFPLLGLAGLLSPAAHASPVWSHDFSPKVEWYQMTDAGVLLAATSKAVVWIPSTGACSGSGKISRRSPTPV